MTLLGNTRLVVACVVLSIVLISHHAAADEYCEETSHDSASAWRQCALGEGEGGRSVSNTSLLNLSQNKLLKRKGQTLTPRQSALGESAVANDQFSSSTYAKVLLQEQTKCPDVTLKCPTSKAKPQHRKGRIHTARNSRRKKRRRMFPKCIKQKEAPRHRRRRRNVCLPVDKFGCTRHQRKSCGCKTCTGRPGQANLQCTSCQDEYGFYVHGAGDKEGVHVGTCTKMRAGKEPVTCTSACIMRVLNKPGMPMTERWVRAGNAEPTVPDFVCSRYCMIRSNIMDLKNKRGKVLRHKLPPLPGKKRRLGEPGADSEIQGAPASRRLLGSARRRRSVSARRRRSALRKRTVSAPSLASDRFESRFSLVTCRLRKIVDCVRVAKSKRKCQVHKSTFCHAIQGYGDAADTGTANGPSVHAPTRAEKDMCKTFPDACAFTTVMN